MTKYYLFILPTFVLLTAFSVPLIHAGKQPRPLHISMAKTFFHDQPTVFVELAAFEFKALMKNTTGLNGEVSVNYSANEIAEKINDKQLDFGILYAHEFAWAQKKYPDLQPILTTASKQQGKRVHIIVHQNSTAKTFADLRGKKFDLPSGTKEYCRIYLDKICADKAKFFGSIVKSATAFEALNQVARNEADATIIDTLWLESYKEIRGPVFNKNLKILQQSDVVPPAVVVCKKGAIDQAIVDRVRAGLQKAHEEQRGRDLMALWAIDTFEAVPKDYAKSLENVLKEYPVPQH